MELALVRRLASGVGVDDGSGGGASVYADAGSNAGKGGGASTGVDTGIGVGAIVGAGAGFGRTMAADGGMASGCRWRQIR